VGGWLEALTSDSSDSYTVPPYGVSHEAVVWAQCSAPILLLAQSRSLCSLSMFPRVCVVSCFPPY
jgi:hypothetical protein